MESKLYIGNLSYSTTEDEIRTLFSQAGTVTSVVVIQDRETGRSKGFAFVEMSSPAEAQKAIDMFNGQNLSNRALRVSIARPREERPSSGGGWYDDRSSSGGGMGDRRGSGPRDRDRDRRSGPGGGGSRRY